jgi:quercetin dioxygenase-like cupin family protein
VIKGKLRMKTTDGSQDFAAGEAFYWGPGHAPEALEDTEYVDVSPTEDLEKVIAHLTGGAG